jgi:hypothetical protein
LANIFTENWGKLKPASFLVIEKSSEDSRRIEAWKGHEVDRSIHPDKRDCMQITDNSVIFDRLIIHKYHLLHRRS